jgi:tripartite-type tricarboxylate transporter receptor subunit TctC
MTITRRLALAAAFVAAAALPAFAQGDYPSKPITMIVPFAAGGPTDTIARIVGEHMSRTLGQQIVVENVAGAGGTTGATRGKDATNDGYTLLMGHMGTHAASVALYPNLAYDPSEDFEPVGLAAGTPVLVLARKDFPAETLAEFIEIAKKEGSALNNANAGIGSVSHVSCLFFNALTGAKPTEIPYKGTGPALNDLMAGQVDYLCDQIVNAAPQIQAGTIKAYAIGTPARSPALPDVPTSAEAGLPDWQVQAWNAIFAPKDTDPAIVAKLSAALDAALDDEATQKRLLELGSVIPEKNLRTSDGLGAHVKSEIAKWSPIIKQSGVTVGN